MPGWAPRLQGETPEFQLTFARLVTHNWSHACFLTDGQILRDMDRLAGIRATLVHGRYDVSSPLDTAWRLHRAWPGSRLSVVDDAGHGGVSLTSAVIDALTAPSEA